MNERPATTKANGASSTRDQLGILILAPTSNDARLTAAFLERAGLEADVCADIRAVRDCLRNGCGALLLAEEAFGEESAGILVAELKDQPSWSDLPVILITAAGGVERLHPRYLEMLEPVGNVSIIERPVHPGTLVSTCEVALRSRRRQYQVRDLLREREEMMVNIQQQSRIFDTTLSSITDFAYIFDRSGRFIYANRALLDLLGLTLDELSGKTFFELPYPDELAARLDQQIKQVFETGEIIRDETQYTNPAGYSAYYEYIFTPVFGNDGRVEVVSGSTRNTSERHRSEEALREADRRKDEFLAMLAHELRNPLAAIANASSLLDSENTDDREWAGRVVKRQSGQLARLIDDLLDVSRITTGKIRLRKEVIDVAVILDRARDSASPAITSRGHKLISNYHAGKLWIECDPTRIEQVVLNLLANAAKYTPPGGRIDLSASRLDAEILITVQDNGLGISPGRLPEMFQLFAQGERSIARSEGGLGIGLTIVQKLVDMHGGRIEAHSDGLNQGSTFTICLPAATAVHDAMRKSPGEIRGRGHSRRVLIVDDNIDTAQGMARLLRRAGHHVALAHDGTQAVERAREDSPEFVVLDIGLPTMDGYEVVRRLRREPCCEGAVIIAITGYGQPEDRQRAIEAGFDHHMVKPIDFEELQVLLRKQAPAAQVSNAGGS
jgi:PAS domain S-box-containing protein